MLDKTIGFALCGSFCTYAKAMAALKNLTNIYAKVIPIFSQASWETDSRFGTADGHIRQAEDLCSVPALHTIPQVEPIGPKKLLDVLLVAPCTGNTLGKLANGITDTSVTMAVKAHLRNARPVVLAVSTNDALANAGKNIGLLFNSKNIYFVPMRQDNATGKPTSVVADFTQIVPAVEAALQARQVQPLFC